jgi:hypothetical protein
VRLGRDLITLERGAEKGQISDGGWMEQVMRLPSAKLTLRSVVVVVAVLAAA